VTVAANVKIMSGLDSRWVVVATEVPEFDGVCAALLSTDAQGALWHFMHRNNYLGRPIREIDNSFRPKAMMIAGDERFPAVAIIPPLGTVPAAAAQLR
jgi:hypothetical protein